MSSAKRAELEQRRESLARNEQLARTGPPRSRFAYAAAATKQRAAIARLERELGSEEPSSAARMFIGRSHSGTVWHLVPKPGTAFPIGACGADVSWHRLKGSQPFEAVTCKRCRRIGVYSITPKEES